MGLASTPHCALMCGAPCAAITRRCAGASSRPNRALWAWHGGRLLAYVAAGAVAASAVGLIAIAASGSAVMRPLWTMMQAAVLVLGAAMLLSGRMPAWVDGAAQAVARLAPDASRSSRSGARLAALIGLGWVAMPCAVLYGALAVAALAAGPLEGATVMAAFALGSAPGLAGLPFVWRRLARVPQSAALRLAGAMLAAGSLWALWHGMEAASGAWCLPA